MTPQDNMITIRLIIACKALYTARKYVLSYVFVCLFTKIIHVRGMVRSKLIFIQSKVLHSQVVSDNTRTQVFLSGGIRTTCICIKVKQLFLHLFQHFLVFCFLKRKKNVLNLLNVFFIYQQNSWNINLCFFKFKISK